MDFHISQKIFALKVNTVFMDYCALKTDELRTFAPENMVLFSRIHYSRFVLNQKTLKQHIRSKVYPSNHLTFSYCLNTKWRRAASLLSAYC